MFPKMVSFDLFKDSSILNTYNEKDLNLLKKVYTVKNPLLNYDFIFNQKNYSNLDSQEKELFEKIIESLRTSFAKYLFQKKIRDYKFIQSELKKEKLEYKNQLEEKNKENLELEETLRESRSKYETMIREIQSDFEKYKARVENEKVLISIQANQRLILNLLPVLDGFDSALNMTSDDLKKDSFYQGIILIQKQFSRFLEQENVEKIPSVGEFFNPNLHEAMQIYKTKNKESDGKIIEEWQKGYMLKGKLIRPSKVVVAELEK